MRKTEPFDKYCDHYDQWFTKNIDIYESELEAIRQLIPPHRSEGLEVGVGSGKFAVPPRIKIGVEPSENRQPKQECRAFDLRACEAFVIQITDTGRIPSYFHAD